MPLAIAGGCLRVALVFLALLGVAAASAAQGQTLGELRAEELHATTATLSGALELLALGGPATVMADGLEISLAADRVVIETRTSSQEFVVAGAVSDTSRADVSYRTMQNVSGALEAWADGHEVFVVPRAAGVTLETSPPIVAAKAGEGHLTVPDRAYSGRPTPKVETTGTVQANFVGTSHMTGDFTLVLWGWVGNLTGNQGSHEVDSGHREEAVDDPTGLRLVRTQSTTRHVFLHVTGGDLRMASPQAFEANLAGPALQAGKVSLVDVTGRLRGGGDLRLLVADEAVLMGSLHLSLGAEEQLHLGVRGRLDGAEADGRTLSWVAAGSDETKWRFAFTWALPVLVLPALFARWRRSRHTARFEDAEFLVRAGHSKEAASIATSLLDSRTVGREATVAAVQAKLELGQWRDAQAILLRRPWRGADAGLWNYLLAVVQARAGDAEALLNHLERACRVSPHLVDRILFETAFAPYLERPDLHAMVARMRDAA